MVNITETTFGDLNGPLMYRGPSTSTQTTSTLTTAEENMLLRLRARLEDGGSGTVGVTEALELLLDAPRLVGSAI